MSMTKTLRLILVKLTPEAHNTSLPKSHLVWIGPCMKHKKYDTQRGQGNGVYLTCGRKRGGKY